MRYFAGRKEQRACKPGSVASPGEPGPLMAIHLDQRLPSGSRTLPPQPPENRRCTSRSRGVLRNLGLLRVGFTVPLPLLVARCALTAPFHPYRDRSRWRFAFCGTFPELTLAGRYPAPCFRGARTFLTDPKRISAAIQPSAGPSPQPRQARCKALLTERKQR